MVAEKVEAAVRLISKINAMRQPVQYRCCLAWAHVVCCAEDIPVNKLAVNAALDGVGETQSCQILLGIGEPEEAQDFRASYS